MKKILLSLGMIVGVGALIATATGSFFSDTETSTGNTFTAGAIDLQVDSTQHYNGMVCVNNLWQAEPGYTPVLNQYPAVGSDCTGRSWALKDLAPTADKFFSFGDVKPGDSGEDTISLHIDNNEAWGCVDITNMTNLDNSCTEPESAVDLDGPTCGTNGELAKETNFFAWSETDGDNIFEGSQNGEYPLFTNTVGPASDALNNKHYTLADSSTVTPLPPGSTRYIGMGWCAGTLNVTSLTTGGWTCDGSSMGNETQTDSFTADVAFRVEQSRNNPSFLCSTP